MPPTSDPIRLPPPLSAADTRTVRRLSRQLGITEVTAAILFSRGLRDAQSIEQFLDPGLRHLSPLEAWPGLLEAADTLAACIHRHENIAVWGDYDVDGITSTALFMDFFRRKQLPIAPFIPSRFDHGYGLNETEIDRLADAGIQVLITVDCGINDHASVDHAKSRGMTVIVTDHHLPGESLPEADGIVNPKLGACPCPDLAGVGVAFLLIAALNRLLPPALDVRPLLDLVALGTIADVVPLMGENRILVKNGLLFLKAGKRPGIAGLKKACALEPDACVGSGDVGFGLAPRLNAAGRLTTADSALELLTAETLDKATPLANKLNRLNSKRKTIEQTIVTQALDQLQENDPVLGQVFYGANWHQGVLGIAASRITEHTYRPTILLSDHNGLLKGSGRSISDINLFDCLTDCKDLLHKFGGHPMAAGLTIAPENLCAFRKRFDAAVSTCCKGICPARPSIKVDAELSFDKITPVLLAELDSLQPFGPGSPRPVFLSPRVRVVGIKSFSQNRHISLNLRDEPAHITLRALAWRQGDNPLYQLHKGAYIRIAFTPRQTIYRGLVGIELTVKELFLLEE
ncbi:single-stranded-DNA-specific exonuclease RecJ [Desulfoplanes sp. PS50]